MNDARRIVGSEPALPWPLSAWSWWTEPVRAERLAALRICLGLVLLADVLFTYLPGLDAFFSANGIADPAAYAWYWRTPKANWSLLRGPGDSLVSAIALLLWSGLAVWAFVDAWGRSQSEVPPPLRLRFYVLWSLAGFVVSAGVWARTLEDSAPRQTWWIVPGLLTWVQLVHVPFLALQNLRANRRFDWISPSIGVAGSLGVVVIGWRAGHFEKPAIVPLLESWQANPVVMRFAIGVWIAAVLLWTLGLATRVANIVAWVMAMSFANVNPYAENAGDTVRNIVLFTMMFAPTGAAWSIDSWRLRRKRRLGPAYIYPWPLALLFLQMTCIYFFNGLYKAGGASWQEGDSLYLALGDVTLTRFSIAQLHPPLVLTRVATYSVLVWELAFPLLALFRWTRSVALVFGVGFHIGIGVLMEIGSFVPVMLTLYVPFLPWDRWLSPTIATPQVPIEETGFG
ncbi:MAG: HTTM domain-containing protein [Gemmataceae bacterium]